MRGAINISVKNKMIKKKIKIWQFVSKNWKKTSPISLSSKTFFISEIFRFEFRNFLANRLINIAKKISTADLLFLDFRSNYFGQKE